MRSLTGIPNCCIARFVCSVVLVLAFTCQGGEQVQYIPGSRYYGRNEYIEYTAGNAPVILTAPHGGGLTPSEIPDRTWGTMATDRNTAALAYSFVEAFHKITGLYPHVVLCHLKRTKFDANRDIGEAAQGNPWAEQAWREWHGFIDIAKETAVRHFGGALYMDLHGHAHAMQRLELGYNIGSSTLALSDEEIGRFKDRSSLRWLATKAEADFGEMLRGEASFGALMEARGFASVPSPQYPHPDGKPYFSGGYNTRRHTSQDVGRVSGFQIECNFRGVRDTSENRTRAAAAFAESAVIYMARHFRIDLTLAQVDQSEQDVVCEDADLAAAGKD